NLSKAVGPDTEVEQSQSSVSPTRASKVVSATLCGDTPRENATGVREYADLPILLREPNDINLDKARVFPAQVTDSGGGRSSDAQLHSRKRIMSCPPGANRSVIFGPWSLEWLHDHNHGDAGGKAVVHGHKKRKAGGMFRHSSLKKVARLPCKDRREVLNILKKNVRRRSGRTSASRSCEVKRLGTSEDTSSSASVNNDWKHWVVMHGNEKMAVDDVWGIGKAIGVKFKSDNANMFSALSRANK
ncbi:DUF4283 domain protein, partial [Trifolium medium]|nr:DUF4283 domain protein [Trifolium medium]